MSLPRKRKEKPSSEDLPKRIQGNNLNLKTIHPKTYNQKIAFDEFYDGKDLVMVGSAGTGKTFLSLFLALNYMQEHPEIYTIKIIRSSVSTRDNGFLPGNISEKLRVFEAPYEAAVNELYGRGDAYRMLKDKKIIEFESTSYLRGLNFSNTIIIVDELQNQTFQELETVLTRRGENTRLIITGDTRQDDLTSERYKEYSGASKMIKILQKVGNVSVIEFSFDDIVRSDFVKKLLIAIEEYETDESFRKDKRTEKYQLITENLQSSIS